MSKRHNVGEEILKLKTRDDVGLGGSWVLKYLLDDNVADGVEKSLDIL